MRLEEKVSIITGAASGFGKGIAKKLLQLVKQKTGKEIILQEPISPLGSKLLNLLNKWK